MFSKFAEFWIKNGKIAVVLMIVVLFAGIFSYFKIPKQYNPDIQVPTYTIKVPAPRFSSKEVNNLVVQPLENKLKEIKGVENTYGYAGKDGANVMVSYYVGTDQEDARIRLYNKLEGNLGLKPLGVKEPEVTSIDPDNIPIYTFAIAKKDGKKLTEEQSIKLRKIAQDVKDKVKKVENTSVLYVVGGEKDNINIQLDLKKLQSRNIDVMQVYNTLKQNNVSMPGGDMKIDGRLSKISVDGDLSNLDKVKNLIVSYKGESPVYLQDIADVSKGVSKKEYQTFVSLDTQKLPKNAVYLGIAKKEGTNAVNVVKDIKSKLDEISKDLPDSYTLMEVKNDGQTASNATNMLITSLFSSIFIVIIVLSIFLGGRNALNTAISIPLTLSIVFLVSYIMGDNINRITLFALILVLGMLVDDSTVVVENVNRHLKNRGKEGVDKLEAVKNAIKEVELGVILSTVTRLLAFGAMLFVTGMMGEYMGPIPKYATIALITSTAVALSINPFLSYVFSDKLSIGSKKLKTSIFKNIKYKIGKAVNGTYHKILNGLLGDENKKRRKVFKMAFWIVLGIVVVVPPTLQIFKARMLPKANKQQFYIWMDAPKSWNISQTMDLAKDANSFLNSYKNIDIKSGENNDKLSVIENISYRAGVSPVPNFANMFRGSYMRDNENQLSMRVNIIPPSDRELSSEDFVIKFRPKFIEFINKKYPNVDTRLLEDPPGPPVRSTFMLEVSGKPGTEYSNMENIATYLKNKLYPVLKDTDVVDLYTTKEKYQRDYKINLDHELMTRLLLSASNVAKTINTVFDGSNISIYHNKHTQEPINIFLTAKNKQKYNIDAFEDITFATRNGDNIPLTEIADIQKTEADKTIMTEDRLPTVYVYGEMGEDSVVYPMVSVFQNFLSDGFWQGDFEVLSWSPYGFEIKDNSNGKEYKINFGGEWELTMDTFRDFGLAMIIAVLAIYFMMVAQFKSFATGGNIMLAFLLGFLGVFPGYTILYLINGTYFSATSMIGVIALAGIVVGNSILLVEYMNIMLSHGQTLKSAIIEAGMKRLKPIIITSLTTVLGATTILGDPVWSGLARSIIWGLSFSAVLTLIVIPVFVYDNLNK